jgi:hypothetical protein
MKQVQLKFDKISKRSTVKVVNLNFLTSSNQEVCFVRLIRLERGTLMEVRTELIEKKISYIKMKVCVCVCVCVSGGLPPGPNKPSSRNLAGAPHFTRARHRARGRPKMSAPRGTSHTDPV